MASFQSLHRICGCASQNDPFGLRLQLVNDLNAFHREIRGALPDPGGTAASSWWSSWQLAAWRSSWTVSAKHAGRLRDYRTTYVLPCLSVFSTSILSCGRSSRIFGPLNRQIAAAAKRRSH